MANFRAERLFIRIQEPIDGFDPNQGIDVEEFATAMVLDQQAYGRDNLSKFSFGPGDKPRWYPALSGLKIVRACIGEVEQEIAKEPEARRKESLKRKIETLRAVENRLDIIDTYDRRFYFMVRDLA